MIGIGLYAYSSASKSSQDYLLGGRKLGPAVTALSVGASDMSGWILMGLPGAVFVSGLTNGWIALGLLMGAYLNYRLVAPKLRIITQQLNDAITLPGYFAARFASHARSLKILSAIVILIFFTVYTTSGIVAGGKLAESAFGLPYQVGITITVGIVLFYTLLGGFLAVSLTDFVQGCIMLITFIILPIVVVSNNGGGLATFEHIQSHTEHLNLVGTMAPLAIISSLAWGLGYFGQPHILVRFMAIKSVEKLSTARRIGMSWMAISLVGTIIIGLAGVVAVAQRNIPLSDPETIVISLAQTLLHPAIAGLCLAAILAAIMSTISSQLLVTASALSEDLLTYFSQNKLTPKTKVNMSRVGVVIIAVIATMLASDRSSGVLQLVANAWAGFGAAFGPLVVMSLYYKKMTGQGALAGVLVGALTILIWEYGALSWNNTVLPDILYSMVPGVVFSSLAIVVVSHKTQKTMGKEVS